jgi:hypothetical protein
MVAAWCFMLAAALWSASAAMPPVASVALAVIGLAPAWMMLTLARRPEPTLARILRTVDQGGAA